MYENNFKFIKNIPEYIAEVPEANLLKMDSVNESEISGDSVFSVLKDSAECLMEDTIEITERIDSFAIEKSSEHLASPKKNVPEKEKFELVDAVAKRELSTIFVADTMDYRIIGTICEHIVRSEETLIRISLKHYGDKRLWPYIVKYNNMVKPNDLACDMVLKIPRLVPVD